MPETYSIQQLAKITSDFVVKKRGSWNHDDWQSLCGSASALGLATDNAEISEKLGLLLEIFKEFYLVLPKRVKTAAKKKAKSKAKTRAKSSRTKKTTAPANTHQDAPPV